MCKPKFTAFRVLSRKRGIAILCAKMDTAIHATIQSDIYQFILFTLVCLDSIKELWHTMSKNAPGADEYSLFLQYHKVPKVLQKLNTSPLT